jgi:dTDP-4-amino-4,6-dideoxygalactose transaminase
MLDTQFSPWPSYSQEEANAVKRVLLSNKVNYWTGEECRKFEFEFAAWCGVKHAIALANGTVSLDLALKAIKISFGDDVITTPRTFIASVSCIVNAGANPVFVDVDLDSQLITAETIKSALTPNTKAVIVVHLAGRPAEMDAIMRLSEEHGFYVIEDCAQAHGAKYKGRSVGSIGHIGSWSFCQDKIMTTGGEGGMVTTNDSNFWSIMWSYKDHGKDYDAVYNKVHPTGFRWVHNSFGSNWRMTEMQAVIGRIQLTCLNNWTVKRQTNASILDRIAQKYDCIRSIKVPSYIVHAEYKHYLFLNLEKLKVGWSRDLIVSSMVAKGVPCFQGGCSEVYLEKAFDKTSWRPVKRLPNTVLLGETSLMFLVHPTLTQEEIDRAALILDSVLEQASL